MTHTLSSIKDLTLGAIKLPVHMARATGGLLVGALRDRLLAADVSRDSTTDAASDADQPVPVNVVDELGLDPAPVAEQPGDKPITSIDAAADPDAVNATPADIAARVSGRTT